MNLTSNEIKRENSTSEITQSKVSNFLSRLHVVKGERFDAYSTSYNMDESEAREERRRCDCIATAFISTVKSNLR